MENLDGMMRRISALIAKAESSTFPEEEATYRAKAEELMARYRIEEEELISTSEVSSILPTHRDVVIAESESEFRNDYAWLWATIARHCGVRSSSTWKMVDGRYAWTATVVGYDVDIRLAEMLFNSARLVFGAHLEPKQDASETDAENIYRMRNAGMERNRIANLLWGSAMTDGSVHGRVAKLYKAECEKRGEQPRLVGRGVNARTYREVYSMEFVNAFQRRLRISRDAADAAVGALVSVGRAERVQEARSTPSTRSSGLSPRRRAARRLRDAGRHAASPRQTWRARIASATATPPG